MDLHAIDHVLGRLRAAAERIAANLLAVESDSTSALLDVADLEGVSAMRWRDARAVMAWLFESHASLRDVLDRAAALRDRAVITAGRADRLEALLLGPSVEVGETWVPVHERHLLSDSRVVDRCSPEDLVERMVAAHERVRATLAEVAAVWDTVPARVSAARERLAAATAVAADLGVDEPDLDHLARHVEALARTTIHDPLAVRDDELAGVEEQVARLADRLARAVALREDAQRQLDAARVAVEQLQRDQVAARHRCEVVAARYAAHHVPPAADVAPALGAELSLVVAAADRRDWASAAARLDAWERAAAAARRDVESVVTACDALDERRREVRHRLDAYRSMAGAWQLVEDPALEALRERAHAALSIAPVDVDEADALVQRYAADLRRARREVRT